MSDFSDSKLLDLIQKVERLESYGMQISLTEFTAIERSGQRFWIAGVDDPHFYRTHDFAAAHEGIPADACSVLLCHSPDHAVEAPLADARMPKIQATRQSRRAHLKKRKPLTYHSGRKPGAGYSGMRNRLR